MGINPRYAVNRNVPVASERYRMLLHHLSSYLKYEKPGTFPFHHHPNFGLFSCASQVQLDVEEKDLPEVLNTFSKLEPYKALLFANSVWQVNGQSLLCARDYFWRNSLHGLTELLAHDRTIYHQGYTAAELRQMFVQKNFPGNIFDRKAISKILIQILDLSHTGLAKRGRNEEVFLEPLYPRAEKLESPALEMLNGLENGKTMEDYIEKFGKIQ